MCGIAGIIGQKASKESLHKMLFVQKHRGPDFTGTYIKNNVALGDNRLSIIGMSANANQPFISNCRRFVLCFNGEIYNYLELKNELKNSYDFKTVSDIEVLLAAYIKWGENCLRRLNGMFSFTIWDTKKQTLFAARDRFGVKPFYYALKGNSFYFASEIKKYKEKISFEDVKDIYKNLLEDSIKLRFRSDVSIGFNVSGGLDSSAPLALVNKNEKGQNINAYTFYTNNSDYDELPWVESLLKHTKKPLEKVRFDANQVKELSDAMSTYQDEPFGGVPTMAYAEIFKKARKDGVIVLLDGQGMDEQWAGYDNYLSNINSVIQGVNKSPFKPKVLNDEFLKLAKKPEYPKPFDSDLLNLQFRDLFYTKIPRALRFNDRISMANSTELREVFLDYRLVEFAFAQPLNYKIKDGIQKYLLRSLISEYLSDDVTYAPKCPLQTPQREWLANDLKDWVQLKIGTLKNVGWFNEALMEKELQYYFNKNEDSSFHIWQWINTSLLLNSSKNT